MAAPASSPPGRSSSQGFVVIPGKKRRRRWPWVAGFCVVLTVAVILEARHQLAHAQPILRARVIETLSARFKTKVELADFDVGLADGLNVSGKGLKIFGPTDPNPSEPGVQALISIREFRFRTGLANLFHSPMHLATVYVRGIELNIPPEKTNGV